MSTLITWITGREPPPMSMRSWRRSTGQTSRVPTANCVRKLHTRPDIRPTALRSRVLAIIALSLAPAALAREVHQPGLRRGHYDDTTTIVHTLNQPRQRLISGDTRLSAASVPRSF